MAIIVDPMNENYAVVDGDLGVAVRLIFSGAIKNPAAPTVAELDAAMVPGAILGYSTGFTRD